MHNLLPWQPFAILGPLLVQVKGLPQLPHPCCLFSVWVLPGPRQPRVEWLHAVARMWPKNRRTMPGAKPGATSSLILPFPHRDAIIILMRTTLNIPDDVYQVARSLANMKGVSLGEAVAELVRQGLNPVVRVDAEKPFPCFVLPRDTKPITLAQTLDAEDEL